MDGAPKAGGEGQNKAVVPVPAGSDAKTAGAARLARRAPSAEDAAVAADAPAAAEAGAGTAGEEENDDEQVERFYALLDNIRAMRGGGGAYGPSDGDGVETGGGGGGARKRLRGVEPPWRPAFRLEDFVEPSPSPPTPLPCDSADAARRAKRTRRQDAAAGEEGGARPAVASSPTPPRRAGLQVESGRKSISDG